MAVAAAKPRWADVFDSSQEDEARDSVGPLPSLARLDSSQSMSQTQSSQASMCELLEGTELSSQTDADGSSAAPAASTSAPEPRAPLSSVLTAATQDRKRHSAQPSPVAKKRSRYRKRKVSAKDDDETSASNNGCQTEEGRQKRVDRRREAIERRKRKPDYMAFSASRPRHLRGDEEPMTPNPEENISKRPWEAKFQQWRKGVRTWYAKNVKNVADEIDDVSSDSEVED